MSNEMPNAGQFLSVAVQIIHATGGDTKRADEAAHVIAVACAAASPIAPPCNEMGELANELKLICDRAGREWAYFPLIERAEKALRAASRPSASVGREEIAKIIDPDAKFDDIEGVRWSRFDLQRRDLANSKADVILALLPAPAAVEPVAWRELLSRAVDIFEYPVGLDFYDRKAEWLKDARTALEQNAL